MKLLTIAFILSLRSILTVAKSIRGSSNNNDDVKIGRSADVTVTSNGEGNLGTRRDPRIIGGQQAATGRYKYSVSLQDRIGHFCGGSLIARDVVLSAAHCAGGEYDVVIDRPNLNSQNAGQKISMKSERPHPDYNYRTTNNDYMLVFLDEPVDMSGGMNLVELNSSSNYPNVGQKVTVMGYGDTNPSDNVSDLSSRLMEVEVSVISNADCNDSSGSINGFQDSYNGQITSEMICARETNKDACQGDSGGPLVVLGSGNNDKQIGVVSWGIGCASRDFPGVYARVSEVYDWIREEVCDNSVDPAASFSCGGSGNNGGGDSNGGGNNGGGDSNGGGGNNGGDNNGGGGNNDGGDSNGGGLGAGSWTRLFDEDFNSGKGRFEDNTGARFKSSTKGKSGVMRIQKTAKMMTKSINVKKYSKCQAKVSFMMIGMEKDDDFCIESCSDGSNDCNTVKCFDSGNYNNKRWWEDQVASFPVNGVDEIKVLLRCKGDSKKDDVLINDVKLECQ